MGSLIIGFFVLIFLASRYDKWDTTKKTKGNITIDEIQDMFENSNDKEQYK